MTLTKEEKRLILQETEAFTLGLNNKSWDIRLGGQDLPGGPVVKTTPSSAGGLGLSPGWGGKITHVLQSNNQNINNKSWYYNKFNKDFEKVVFKRRLRGQSIYVTASLLQSCLAHQAPLVQARILEWIAISFSMRSSQPRDWTWVSGLQVDSLLSEPLGTQS